MSELNDLLAENHYPRFRLIHDCVDTGADFALTASTPVAFPCDCVTRDYQSQSGTTLWNSGTSNFKDSIANASIAAKFSGVVNGPINTILHIRLSIPHPTFGDIPVDDWDYTIKKNNSDVPFVWLTEVYNATDGEAHLYGFDVSIEATANCTLKGRSVYIRT